MKTINCLFIILILNLICSCHGAGSQSSTAGIDGLNLTAVSRIQFSSEGMVIADVDTTTFENVVRANGNIEVPASGKAYISCLMPGVIKSIALTEGDFVRKGQVLFVLENMEYIKLQQDYLEASHSLDYLRAEYERQQSLLDGNITSQKNYLNAKSEYEKITSKCEALAQMLRMINIDPSELTTGNIVSEINMLSPFDGVVISQNSVPGMYVEPQQAVVEIADISRLRLRINIFEKDISGIRGWQTVRFRKGDELNGWYYGTVDNVGRSVDPVTRMIPVFVRLHAGAGNNFIDGMYVEAEIIKDDRKAPGLPNGAVHAEEDKYFVFTKVNETADSIIFKKLYINRGQVNDEMTEIISTAPVTDVLVQGSYNLASE